MSDTHRNYFIDNLKVLLIFSVVFGHLIERYINDSEVLRGIYIFIYIFHMPLFIFISGFFSKNVEKIKKGAIKNLLVPYIVFNIIWYTVVYIYTGEYMFSLVYPGWTLWYLLSLFFWRISLKYLVKIKYILPISFALGIFIGIMPMSGTILSISRTIVFLPYFLLGYYSNQEKLERMEKINKWYAILGVIIFMLASIYIGENNLIGYKFFYNSETYQSFGLSIFEGILYRGALYIGAIMLSIFVAVLTPTRKTFYSNIAKSAMNIYVFHIYLVILVFYLLPNWNVSTTKNFIILASPLLIMYILSLKVFQKIYDFLFLPINKLKLYR